MTGFEVAGLDLREHLFDVADGERMARCRPDGLYLLSGIDGRLASPRRPKSLTDPLGDSHPLRARRPLDFAKLPLLEKDLKSLTHRDESILLNV